MAVLRQKKQSSAARFTAIKQDATLPTPMFLGRICGNAAQTQTTQNIICGEDVESGCVTVGEIIETS